MRPPIDYPVIGDTNPADSCEDMTFAALLDRHESELAITDAMIESARTRIETAQHLPFATKAEPIETKRFKPVLARLLRTNR